MIIVITVYIYIFYGNCRPFSKDMIIVITIYIYIYNIYIYFMVIVGHSVKI